MFTLDDILGLVGTLDDRVGADTPRERFRRFLQESVRTTGAIRDYVEACVRNKGPQYDHALQDLVNHAAALQRLPEVVSVIVDNRRHGRTRRRRPG